MHMVGVNVSFSVNFALSVGSWIFSLETFIIQQGVLLKENLVHSYWSIFQVVQTRMNYAEVCMTVPIN